MKRKCLMCKNKFNIPKSPSKKDRKKFCSLKCRNKGNSILSAKKRGDVQRGRGQGKSYIKFYGRHQHRVVMEEKIGRKLKKGEVVHHIDENKRNNNPNNLQLMTLSEHSRYHTTIRHNKNKSLCQK